MTEDISMGKGKNKYRFYLWDYLWWLGEKWKQRRSERVDGSFLLYCYIMALIIMPLMFLSSWLFTDWFPTDTAMIQPYFYERFCRAMEKAVQWLRMHDLMRVSESPEPQLLLKSEYKNVKVSVDTILYIESIGNYVKLHLADGASVLSKIPLCNIEEQLPKDEFVRIHRSFVVARNRIAGFTRLEVIIAKSGKSLPVGKKYADSLMEVMGK